MHNTFYFYLSISISSLSRRNTTLTPLHCTARVVTSFYPRNSLYFYFHRDFCLFFPYFHFCKICACHRCSAPVSCHSEGPTFGIFHILPGLKLQSELPFCSKGCFLLFKIHALSKCVHQVILFVCHLLLPLVFHLVYISCQTGRTQNA